MIDAIPVIKVVSTVAASAAKQQLRKRTFRFKVAYLAAREAHRAGIEVRVRAIAGWLERDDTRELLQTGDHERLQPAEDNLALRVGGANRAADAERLMPIVLRHAALALGLGEALANAEARITAKIDAAAEPARAVIEQYSAQGRLPENLLRLHPWRAEPASRIARTWPAMAQIVGMLAESPKPADVLDEWATTVPRILGEAPSEVYVWLGEVAADYKAGAAAVLFYSEAIHRGAVPRDYLLARAALAVEHADADRAKDLIGSSDHSEPLSAALSHLQAAEPGSALTTLEQWQPTSANDVALCAILSARVLADLGRDDEATYRLVTAARADPAASGPAILAALYLTRRARFGAATSPYRDADDAQQLAVQARNARRLWRGDSASAVVVAIGAAAMFGDLDRAIALATAAPEGEATSDEAADEAVAQERAVLLAMAAPLDVAIAAAAAVKKRHPSALVAGVIALRQGDTATGMRLLLEAYECAEDDGNRIRTARLLATEGLEIPDLSDLSERHPDVVKEIRQLLAALKPGPDRVARLRAHEHENPQIAIALAEAYAASGRDTDAADTLERAGVAFTLPGFTVEAARKRVKLGDTSAAISLCESAIAMGGPRWPGEFLARACMFDALQIEGRIDEALQQARALVALDPTDRSAAWALVRTNVQLGDIVTAQSALGVYGEPIPPRDAPEARLWVQLVVRSPRATSLISRTLDVIRQWWDAPALAEVFVTSLMFFGPDDLDPADAAALEAVLAELLVKAQQGETGMRMISAGPEEDPLKELLPMLRARYESTAELAGMVAQGDLPVGMLSLASGTVTEALLNRFAGKVYGYSEHGSSARAAIVDATLDGRCVVDLTAVATLSLLDESVADDLRSRFVELVSTQAQFGDALEAQATLKVHVSGSMAWDPETQSARVTRVEESDAAELERRADLVVDLLRRTRRSVQKGLPLFPDLKRLSGIEAWLGAAELAAALDLPLWCDDMVLAPAIADKGVRVFGTVDLLRHLRSHQRLKADLADATEAVLLHHYYVDLGFRPAIQTHAAELAGWASAGAAFSMTRSAAWRDPEPAMRFIETAVTRANTPQSIAGWIGAAATGVTADLESAAGSSNLRVLFGRLLQLKALRPDHMPFVLQGIRAPLASTPDLQDPLEDTLREVHGALVAKHGTEVAHVLLLGLMAHATAPDKAVAARIILTA